MAYGLGAFTEGLQGGIAARDKMDLNKQYKRILADRADIADRDWQNYVDLTRENYIQEEGSAEGYVAPQRSQLRDPALIRFGKWLNQRIGFGRGSEETGAAQQADFRSPQVLPAGPQKSGAMTYGIPDYADGGRVRRYKDPDTGVEFLNGVPQSEVPTSGGGFMEGLRDLGRAAGEYFDDTRTVALEGDKDVSEGFDRMRGAGSAREAGAGFADWAVGSAKAGLGTAAAVGKDAFVDNPVTQFVGGVLGFDGGGSRQGSAGGAIPAQPGPAPDAKAAVDSTLPEPEDNERVAQQAIDEGETSAVENLDYKLLVDQGVSPEELPSMTTQDWSDYRRSIFKYELGRGASATEAMRAVDELTVGQQMKGFQREGRKALLYLQTGQAREAAMALRQAYQYFPNGVGVKFGTASDPKTGQPTIIAMGVDEQTGEPSGKPMLITTERLNAMMENLSNPSAFRTWTKDGRDLQMEIAQLESLDNYRQGSLEVSRAGAITDRIEAEADRTRAISGRGISASEELARNKFYVEQFENAGLLGRVDEEVMGELASLAAQIDGATSKQPAQIVEELTSAWLGQDGGRGGEAGLIEYLQRLQGG